MWILQNYTSYCFLFSSIGYFTPQGTKSPISYHAIIPVYNNIFPEIIAINKKKKREEKSHLKSFTFSCLVLYMDEKYMIDCNKLGSGIKKLILNAALERTKHSPKFAVSAPYKN